MSDNVVLNLELNVFNMAFGIVSRFDGPISRYAGERIIAVMRDAYKASSEAASKGESEEAVKPPKSISVSIERRHFEGFYQGLTELLEHSTNKPTSGDVAIIRDVSKEFKVSKRIEKFLNERLVNIPDPQPLDDDLDDDLDT